MQDNPKQNLKQFYSFKRMQFMHIPVEKGDDEGRGGGGEEKEEW